MAEDKRPVSRDTRETGEASSSLTGYDSDFFLVIRTVHKRCYYLL